MLQRPKTLPVDVTVAEARNAFSNQSVHMLLLVDGTRFSGAVTTIPDDADPDEPAVRFADESAPIVSEDMPVAEALQRLEHKPGGRLVVLQDERLVGLVCLTRDGMGFCGPQDDG